MTHGSLFSGIGGFDLAADKFCRNEKDLYVCSVLYSERQSILPVCSGHFLCPDATYTRFRTPVWSVNAPTAALV